MISGDALSRTVALFQADFGIEDEAVILRALTNPRITVVASEAVSRSLAGQTAISTAAMLMARTGHQVYIDTPDAVVVGHQPPLMPGSFHRSLEAVGRTLIGGVPITIGAPLGSSDIVFCLGSDLPWMASPAARYISVGASDWAATFSEAPRYQRWSASDWPFGGMAAAVLMAAEASKISALSLAPLSRDPRSVYEQFAQLSQGSIELAPRDTPLATSLGEIDIISAGAVSNGSLYSLLRIPGVAGHARVFDHDRSEETNLNRNMLLTKAHLGQFKVNLFADFGTNSFTIAPYPRNYPPDGSVELVERIVVGVDDIPTRWALARAAPTWMGVGATSHCNSMASVHFGYAACAACLHPRDEALEGPTPTIAFASFFAGLLVAADLLKEVARHDVSTNSHYRYINALRPNGLWSSAVHPNCNCPAGCPASRIKAA